MNISLIRIHMEERRHDIHLVQFQFFKGNCSQQCADGKKLNDWGEGCIIVQAFELPGSESNNAYLRPVSLHFNEIQAWQ